MTTGTAGRTRPQRADARRNYERLLTEARTVIAERGADASLEEIARRSGVGIGTLYRHFPNRHAVLGAVFEEAVAGLAARAEELERAPDPLAALRLWLRELIGCAGRYRGLSGALLTASQVPGSVLARSCAGPLAEAGGKLLDRAAAAGSVRADVPAGDLLRLTNAVALASERAPEDPDLTDRLLALVLRGLRPDPAPVPGPVPGPA
jgi:AcrR family transcriptional regulator